MKENQYRMHWKVKIFACGGLQASPTTINNGFPNLAQKVILSLSKKYNILYSENENNTGLSLLPDLSTGVLLIRTSGRSHFLHYPSAGVVDLSNTASESVSDNYIDVIVMKISKETQTYRYIVLAFDGNPIRICIQLTVATLLLQLH